MAISKPPVSAEWKKIDIDYSRKVAVTQARPWLERFFWLATLASAGVATVLFFVLIIWYLANGTFADRSLVASLGQGSSATHVAYQRIAPKDLQVIATTTLTFGGRATSVVKVKNPNLWHIATANYHDVGLPEETFTQTIFPGAEAWLITAGDPGHRVVVDNTSWSQLSPKDIIDPKQYLEDRSAFSASAPTVSDKTLSFQIANNTSYSFWSATFFVELSRGGSVFSIERITIQDFESGEIKPVILGGASTFPIGVSIRVIPAFDLLNPAIYKPSPAGVLDSRE